MKIYKVDLIISGNNQEPEARWERIVAKDWEDGLEILTNICREFDWIILEMRIVQTKDRPFAYRSAAARQS
jgi:hypothetical protein